MYLYVCVTKAMDKNVNNLAVILDIFVKINKLTDKLEELESSEYTRRVVTTNNNTRGTQTLSRMGRVRGGDAALHWRRRLNVAACRKSLKKEIFGL